MGTLKFGISHSNLVFPAGARAVEAAQAMEGAGFESVWTVEHAVIPTRIQSRYPETSNGELPFAPTVAIPDPLVWLAYVAAAAPNLALGTAVLVLPQRNPLTTAKECATLDELTGGRVILGVGIGWLREEFEALGVPFEQRGRRTDEAVAVMRGLWQHDPFGFEGSCFSFPPVHAAPKPPRSTIPIHIGGYSARAAERAGRIGDGFFPGTGDPEALAELVTVARRAAEVAGRDPDALEVTARGSADQDHLRALANAGAHRVVISARTLDPERFASEIRRLGEQVVAPFGGKR